MPRELLDICINPNLPNGRSLNPLMMQNRQIYPKKVSTKLTISNIRRKGTMRKRVKLLLPLSLIILSFTLAGCQPDNSSSPDSNEENVSIEKSFVEETDAPSETEISTEKQAEINKAIANQYQQAMAKRNEVPPPGDDPYEWIQKVQEIYGQYAVDGTVFHVTTEGNCGGVNGGCTIQHSDINGPIGTTEIYISPSAIGSVHLLFHEIAHSHGIIDECMAEKWAHTVTGLQEWSYDECATVP